MQKDYKHRAGKRYNSKAKKPGFPKFKWFLIILVLALFAGFLIFLKRTPMTDVQEKQQMPLTLPPPSKANKKPVETNKTAPQKTSQKATSTEPKFDFYTILPEKEIVVPDHEVKTRTREQNVGKAKSAHYILQAGSFRKPEDADSFKAELALLGIESKIEKANVGGLNWNRVKIGPFNNIAEASTMRSKLRQNNIDVVVMELD